MKSLPFSLLLFTAVVLAGCSIPATPTLAPAQPTATAPIAAPTAAPTQAPAATETPAATPEGLVRFVLVPEKSQASYAIDETFLNQNNKLVTAVGVTQGMSGELQLNYADPAGSSFGEIAVDISLLKSDSERRDNAIRGRWLESAKFPIARFNVSTVNNFPANPVEGSPISFQLVGDMTIREVTRPVTWQVTAVLDGKELTGTATTQILLADFGVEPPSIAGILNVTDSAALTVDFNFLRE